MARKLKISPTAVDDIQAGVYYYNLQQKGLGKKIEISINDTFKKIAAMPQAASISHNDIRYKVVEKFPFIITYQFDDLAISILRAFNTHLDPA